MMETIYKFSIDVSKPPKSDDYEFTPESKEVQKILKRWVTGSGKSLNPSDAQIRAWEIEETLRRTRKTTGELFPNAGELYATLNKPVNKIKYYQIARCRVKYQVG